MSFRFDSGDDAARLWMAVSTDPGSVLPGWTEVRIVSPLFRPYRLGHFSYDFLDSLMAGIVRGDVRATDEAAWPDPLGRDAAFALWSAIELDLTRFARDPLVRRSLSAAAGSSASVAVHGEERRFARLNDLLRAVARAILPSGAPPRRWRSRMAGTKPPRLPPWAERFGGRLSGTARGTEAFLAAVVPAFAEHGCAVSRGCGPAGVPVGGAAAD
ncbi:MAG: hypothetical protein NT080_11295 [Spirochaetes bacterium]|nr:hypothetical protein [Spirochaetota bacterium]